MNLDKALSDNVLEHIRNVYSEANVDNQAKIRQLIAREILRRHLRLDELNTEELAGVLKDLT